MKNQKVRTKRIAPGYYKFEYKGYNISLISVEGFKQWYFQLNEDDAHDWQPTKYFAMLAAIEYIDYLSIN